MDEDDIPKQEYRLTIWLPHQAQPWHAQVCQDEKVLEFESPLELVAWLEGQLEPARRGLR